MTDVLLIHTPDGGEICLTPHAPAQGDELPIAEVQLTETPETMVYLCLFGGNRDDSGRQGDRLNWWGNLDEPNVEAQYRSEFQYLLNKIPPTPQGARRLIDAATRDLAGLIREEIAETVDVSAVMATRNRLELKISIGYAEGDPLAVVYFLEWSARNEF